jgi:hypothetical protein
MTRGNMRELGVQHLIGFCLNGAGRHHCLRFQGIADEASGAPQLSMG